MGIPCFVVDSSVITPLIAAGAAVVGSAVTFIGSAMTARSNARQTEAKIAADHAAWLRDRRAEVYLQTNAFVRDAAWKRSSLIKDGAADSDLHIKIAQLLTKYTSPETFKLSVDGTTFVNPELAQAVDQALMANLRAWQAFLHAVGEAIDADTPGRHVALDDDTRKALDDALIADRRVHQLIRLDVSWTEYSSKHLRTRRRAQRRQLRQIRKLEDERTDSWGPPTWRLLANENGHGTNNRRVGAKDISSGREASSPEREGKS
jgi:hypothetical protein